MLAFILIVLYCVFCYMISFVVLTAVATIYPDVHKFGKTTHINPGHISPVSIDSVCNICGKDIYPKTLKENFICQDGFLNMIIILSPVSIPFIVIMQLVYHLYLYFSSIGPTKLAQHIRSKYVNFVSENINDVEKE